MVKVSISLLTFALAAMGSALALPVEYERRSELDSNLYIRDSEFVDTLTREDHEELYRRFGIFKLVKAGVKLGVKVAKNKNVQHVAKGIIDSL